LFQITKMGCCSSSENGDKQQAQQVPQTRQVPTQQPAQPQEPAEIQFPAICFKEAKEARAQQEEKNANDGNKEFTEKQEGETIPMTETDPLKDTCTVCNCEMTTHELVLPLACGHIFHTTCVKPFMLAEFPSCPRCKTQFYIPGPDGKVPEYTPEQQQRLQEQQQQQQGQAQGQAPNVTVIHNTTTTGMMPMPMMMPFLMPMFMPRFRPVIVYRPMPVGGGARAAGYGAGTRSGYAAGSQAKYTAGTKAAYNAGYSGGTRTNYAYGGGYGGMRSGGYGRTGGYGRRR
jgi:hypothetical protein